ncbi:MAG: alpha/beta hydrolase [Muribaculaceae bacterium]|nr:alpha/beta hydrolase [Muribaculaceae bacterium]
MRQYIDLDGGTRLAYTVSGEGNPMILMHGWGCNADTLASVEKTAAESHKVYNIDFPGFGKSPEPEQVWGVEDYTRTVENFVRTLGIERPVLLGHSFGGRVGLLYASRNPVDRLILVDAAGVKPKRPLSYYVKVYSFKLMKRIYTLIYGKEGARRRIEAERARRGSADYNAASPRMRAILSKVVNEDLCHVMPDIKAPTLLIYGENDTATPVRDARRIESLVPDAGLVVFPGCGHYSFLDNPYQFAAVLRSFLTDKKQ